MSAHAAPLACTCTITGCGHAVVSACMSHCMPESPRGRAPLQATTPAGIPGHMLATCRRRPESAR
eukprot:6536120-Alexandrium_andersonii.AAC.1